MTEHKKLVIGVFGFGVVGEGLYRVLQQTESLNATIKKICIKNPNKKRIAPKELFTTDKEELLNDKEINVIVEVIDDANAAFDIVSTALKNGKSTVSASKKMIAEHLPELLALQQKSDVPFLYEAAACASIPVIRNLEEYYDNDLLQSLSGIVNGSTNFILTKMFEDGITFQKALLEAQQLGFAESNPDLDILGIDAVNKLAILLVHCYGIVSMPGDILFSGIKNIQLSDAKVASEKGCQIKLIAKAVKLKNGKVAAFLLPHFVKPTSQLYSVKNEFNGVVIESSFSDEQFFYGKGAGSLPTASAVLSDVSALSYNYRYEYKKLRYHKPSELTTDLYLKVYISFDQIKDIPKHEFEWIEEFYNGQDRNYLIGVINFKKLLKDDWWKQPNISLIALPDAIIENVEIRNLKKRSLELAGIVRN
jgi:homoserine dehydrogenase